ncbi:MAG TPA: ABC transporter substrate-binding protein [Actinomycetota bacterium]|nr:ABC transporter substrate-binding protein [Actinomycetota bacterium]
MRRLLAVAALAVVALGACAPEEQEPAGAQGGGGPECSLENPPLYEDGVLTVATDRPAYPPWFEGSPKRYSGYEGEVASEIAQRMDLPIRWVVEPFNKSYAPGAKDYDFDINQISVTPEREEVVDFSDSYFDNSQGVLALKDGPVADARSIDDLRDHQLGTQVGTTSLDFINRVVQPSAEPKVFDTTNDVKSALESGQIDALVTDVVTTVYLRDFEIDGSVVVGRYPTHEPFGMLFEEGNPLRVCVDRVLADMKADGTLKRLQERWLQDYLGVPVLED